MLRYIVKRFFRSFLTLFIVGTFVFSLLRLMPVEGYFPNFDKMSSGQVQAALANQGLNLPLPQQIFRFYKKTLVGDFGKSNKYRERYPVTKIIREKAHISVKMGVISISISILIGFIMGIFMARSTRTKFKIFDRFGTLIVVVIQAIPAVIYHLLLFIYGTQGLNRVLNVSTLFQLSDYRTWILPIISLSLSSTSYYAMWLRRYMVDETNKDYVQLVKAKGVSESKIWSKHIFRNAITPLVQYIPTSILLTLVGSLYVESLYSIPGMGGLLVQSIKMQDNNLVQALVLLFAAIGILGVLIGDIIMVMIDPRIKLEKNRVQE